MSYKLIALDLDGTLCNDEKAVTPRTAAALKQAQKHGIRVALRKTASRTFPGNARH